MGGKIKHKTTHSGPDFIKIGKKIRIFFLGHLYWFPIQGISFLDYEENFKPNLESILNLRWVVKVFWRPSIFAHMNNKKLKNMNMKENMTQF
jgi:hypothetical protein